MIDRWRLIFGWYLKTARSHTYQRKTSPQGEGKGKKWKKKGRLARFSDNIGKIANKQKKKYLTFYQHNYMLQEEIWTGNALYLR